ncbi:RNA-binding protein [Rhodosalinus sp. K401]|uniref:RNA-binding protein n=1 Tax=Rhodosalinus sp. K401 TaxID=3239195 RepID=UPI003524A1CA
MPRGGREKTRGDGPERKCIATGKVLPAACMVRFVVSPDGVVVPDILGKLPGRGIWVAADRAALERAASKGLFARAAKAPVTVPEGLVDEVERQLAQRVIGLVSLARKSGAAVTGYEKVKAWLANGEAEVLIQASDGSERGKTKLSTPHDGSWLGWMTASELGLAFGRETVVHGALASGGLTKRVVEEAARLKGLRASDGGTGHRKG